MRMMFVLSMLGCNFGVKVQDTFVEETETDTDSNSNSNEQSPNETSFTISTNIVGNGVISPVVYQDVGQGETRQFTLMASEGFEISAVTGTCGGTLDNATYTTAPIVADCSVEAQFSQTVAELVPYCENIPPDLVNTVVCDPSFHLDDWSVGAGYNINDIRIPQGKILAIPFTSNAVGLEGTVTITNNMPGLTSSGFRWRGWFSLVPGGEEIESCNPNGDCGRCSSYSPNPNPRSFQWDQIAPGGWGCHLGTTVQTMYLNMEVRCYEFLSSACTPGEFYNSEYYNGDYYVGAWNIVSD